MHVILALRSLDRPPRLSRVFPPSGALLEGKILEVESLSSVNAAQFHNGRRRYKISAPIVSEVFMINSPDPFDGDSASTFASSRSRPGTSHQRIEDLEELLRLTPLPGRKRTSASDVTSSVQVIIENRVQ